MDDLKRPRSRSQTIEVTARDYFITNKFFAYQGEEECFLNRSSRLLLLLYAAVRNAGESKEFILIAACSNSRPELPAILVSNKMHVRIFVKLKS